MAEGVSKYFCYCCNFVIEPATDASVCPICGGGCVEELINEPLAPDSEHGSTTGMMLTHALMNSIVRHAQRSPSANTNSRMASPGSLSAHPSQQLVADSFSPLSSSLCPSTSIVNRSMIGSFGPNVRRGMSELSALIDPSQLLFSYSSPRADRQGESETWISMWSQSSAMLFREADDEQFTKVSSPDLPLLSKTSSVVTNFGQLAAPTLSASSSIVTHDGTVTFDGTEVTDDMTEASDPFNYSDFSTSPRLTVPHSVLSAHAPSYLSRLAWFDAPPRPRSVGEQSSLVASRAVTPTTDGQLLEGLRWSQSDLPIGSSGSTLALTDDYDQTESRAMRVNFDDVPTNMPRPVAQTLSITQLLHNFFFTGQPVVVPFGQTTVHLNPGLVSAAINRDQPYNFQTAMGIFDRVITQLMNQLNVGPAPAALIDIEAVPFIKVSADHIANTSHCAICIEDFQLNESARQLSCGHIFHSECLIRWLELHGTCPVCRCRVSGSLFSEFGRVPDDASISSTSMASVPVVEIANVDDEPDVVTSILDDVTDSLLGRSPPTIGAGSQSMFGVRLMEPAVADMPLLISRAQTPLFSVRPGHLVVPDDEVAASAL